MRQPFASYFCHFAATGATSAARSDRIAPADRDSGISTLKRQNSRMRLADTLTQVLMDVDFVGQVNRDCAVDEIGENQGLQNHQSQCSEEHRIRYPANTV